MFNALSVVKFAVSGIVGIGTGKIVGKMISTHVAPETLIEKVSITAATWVLSGIATKATKKYTNDLIDDVAENITKVVDNIKMGEKLKRVNNGESTIETEGIDPSKVYQDESGKWARVEVEGIEEKLKKQANEAAEEVKKAAKKAKKVVDEKLDQPADDLPQAG